MPSAVQADLQQRLDRDVKPDLFRVVARQAGRQRADAGRRVRRAARRRLLQRHAGTGAGLQLRLAGTSSGPRAWPTRWAPPKRVCSDCSRRTRRVTWCAPTAAPSTSSRPTAGCRSRAPPPADRAAAETPDIEGSAPPSRSKQLIDQLAALVELPPPGRPVQEDAIIAEELSRASENIERRVKRREARLHAGHRPRGRDVRPVRRLDRRRREAARAGDQDSAASLRRQRRQRLAAGARRGRLRDRPGRRRRGGGRRRGCVRPRTAARQAARGRRALPRGDSHRRPSRLADSRRRRAPRAPRGHRHADLGHAVRRRRRAGRVRAEAGRPRRGAAGRPDARRLAACGAVRSTRCSPPRRRRSARCRRLPPSLACGCCRSRTPRSNGWARRVPA